MALEPDVFDFAEWITVNGLSQMKELLVKHDLKSMGNLSTQSPQFAKFISDPVLFQTKSDLITATVQAILKLSTISNVTAPQFIVISEKEENVLKSLQSYLNELKSHQLLADELADKYSKSIQDYDERKQIKIKKVECDIISFTDELMNAIMTKQKALFSELSSLCEEQKETQILSESNILITKQRKNLTSALQNIDHMIHKSVNLCRDDRKQKVLNIGAKINTEFSETVATLNANIHSIQNAIHQNKSMEFDVDFKASKDVQSMVEMIQISTGQNEEYEEEGFVTKQEDETCRVNYEEIIKKQNISIRGLKSKIYKLEGMNLRYQLSNDELKKEIQKNKNAVIKKERKNKTRNQSSKAVWKERGNKSDPQYSTHKSGNLWNVTMHYRGKTMVCSGNTKANAMNNCIDAFEKKYNLAVPYCY